MDPNDSLVPLSGESSPPSTPFPPSPFSVPNKGDIGLPAALAHFSHTSPDSQEIPIPSNGPIPANGPLIPSNGPIINEGVDVDENPRFVFFMMDHVCRDAYSAWYNCRETSIANGVHPLTNFHDLALILKNCVMANSEIHAPVLDALEDWPPSP